MIKGDRLKDLLINSYLLDSKIDASHHRSTVTVKEMN